MEIVQGLLDITQALILLMIIIWLIQIERKLQRNIPIDQKPPSKPLFKPKEHKETEEEKRLRILNENIENYDGSAKGQIKL